MKKAEPTPEPRGRFVIMVALAGMVVLIVAALATALKRPPVPPGAGAAKESEGQSPQAEAGPGVLETESLLAGVELDDGTREWMAQFPEALAFAERWLATPEPPPTPGSRAARKAERQAARTIARSHWAETMAAAQTQLATSGRATQPSVAGFRLDGAPSPRQPGAPAAPAAGIAAQSKVEFKLDPRLTRGLYMGDRWVSPDTYTRVGEGPEVVFEARVPGRDAQAIDSHWTAGDPDMVTVAAGPGNVVKVTVRRPGETSLQVAGLGFSKTIPLKATPHGDTLLVELSQD